MKIFIVYFQALSHFRKDFMNEQKMSGFDQTAATIWERYTTKPKRRLVGTEADTRRRVTVRQN
jgi:hypothetical protein